MGESTNARSKRRLTPSLPPWCLPMPIPVLRLMPRTY